MLMIFSIFKNCSPRSQTYDQHIWSPTSVTNIDVTNTNTHRKIFYKNRLYLSVKTLTVWAVFSMKKFVISFWTATASFDFDNNGSRLGNQRSCNGPMVSCWPTRLTFINCLYRTKINNDHTGVLLFKFKILLIKSKFERWKFLDFALLPDRWLNLIEVNVIKTRDSHTDPSVDQTVQVCRVIWYFPILNFEILV